MTTFVMFFSAFLAMFFFLLCFAIRAVSAALNALFTSARMLLILAGYIILALLILLLIYGVIDEFLRNGFGDAFLIVMSAGLFVVMMVVMIGLTSTFGGGCLVYLMAALIECIMGLIEVAYDACEDNYVRFLRAFMNRIPKS